MKDIRVFLFLLLVNLSLIACDEAPEGNNSSTKRPAKDYIRKIPGENDTIPEEVAQKGEVLIAYSDCYTCHTREKRAKGPSFKDIAQRYPVKNAYIEMLAHRVIAGGSGSWGSPVMDPHPQLSHEKAKIMVTYILSLKD
ncbi:MAG: c-type cytochrome [Anditalea sp.]